MIQYKKPLQIIYEYISFSLHFIKHYQLHLKAISVYYIMDDSKKMFHKNVL